jgi:flagellum-specific peptidoglycan hydrolase FlgJ
VRIILLLLCIWTADSYEAQENYIQNHKDLAIVEMHRTGIPASIKLAQALLESNSGLSRFSKESNNHFGIKCKTYWRGNTYYHKDDDRDQKGELLESCFRAYDRVIDSYVDHSNFLKNSPYYANLFTIPKEDYVSWATELKRAGYATDPLYHKKLINLIERHNLTSYDQL